MALFALHWVGSPSLVEAQICPPSSCGAWGAPLHLELNHNPPPPTTADSAIGHATLIPVGPHRGKILLWTHVHPATAPTPPHKSYIWDFATNSFPAEPDSPATTSDNPFCSGHVWLEDSQGNDRFLVGGGATPGSPPKPASDKVHGFDPINVVWTDSDVPDFGPTQKRWYPGLTVYNDDANSRTVALAVAGTSWVPEQCPPNMYQEWLTLSWSPSPAWTLQVPTNQVHDWHLYPRLLLRSTGDILSAGHEISCDQGTYAPYGGPPVWRIDPHGVQVFEGPDPNAQGLPGQPVEGLHFANAAILHTLKANVTNWPPVPGDYDLDRVFVFGGATRLKGNQALALDRMLELLPPSAGYPDGQWKAKASAANPRYLGNLVILPDGTLFAVGGRKVFSPSSPDLHWNFAPAIFDPQRPTDMGTWTAAKRRPDGPTMGRPLPREDHSVAILLPTGGVAVLGGENVVLDPPAFDESDDWAEIFDPPYMFQGRRPSLQAAPPTIGYGGTFCVQVSNPSQIDRACLIGIASVTHHFDYGQRYMELKVRQPSGSCTVVPGTTGNLEVAEPPAGPEGPAMAPRWPRRGGTCSSSWTTTSRRDPPTGYS